MSRSYLLTLLACISMAILLFTACASSTVQPASHDGHNQGNDTSNAPNTGDPIEGAREIRVVATEFGFEPAAIELNQDEPVNIVLINEGALDHELEIKALNLHVHAKPGKTVTVGFVPSESGEFEFGCFEPGHYEAGMKGQVAVEAPQT